MQLLKGADELSAGNRQGQSKRTGCPARRAGMALSIGLLLLTGGRIVGAQEAHGSAAGQENHGPESQSERPRLLFLLQRPAGATAHRDDPYLQLSVALRTAMEAAKRYDLMLYTPEQPSIKRALLEHTLPVSDLVEPIGPDAFRRIARAIGARYTLTLKPDFEKQSVKTEMRYDEDVDGESWRTGLQEQIGFEAVVGKRHLKAAELVALTVDAICARLSVPSHLADMIKLGQPKILGTLKPNQTPKDVTASNNGTAPDAQGTNAQAPSAQNGGQGAAPVTQPSKAATRSAIGTATAPVPGVNGAGQTNNDLNQTTPNQTTSSQTSSSQTTSSQTTSSQTTSSQAGADPPQSGNAGGTPPRSRSGGKKTQRPQPAPAGTPPMAAPVLTRPDYLALAVAARKDGDISTEITLLRKAVTAAPHDVNLRRQLIQAYQDRHMPDMALAEAERAIALMPADNTLKRLYGDALLAKGNGAGALKVYRDVVAHDPADVAAQVALADALLADNQYAEAMTGYQTAAAADPNSPLPHRRLARVYAGRAGTDPAQYQESLKELTLSRQLTSSGDTDIYLHDYIALMRQMEQRMRDMADELQSNYQAAVQGTRKITEVTRAVSDLKERASALENYLDHVAFAVGHEGTHAHYSEGAAMLVQAIGYFQRVLASGNERPEDAQSQLRVARVETLHELTTANKLLLGTAEPRRVMSNTSAGGDQKPVSIQ
jgi:tetratricopeptide (TPR) repeat protein